ncbi:MAG: pantoate--beta-alanine ligase, partial [Acidobacteriaceae bacterium]|nr:pantoate--beta-alanine ligase [Acidobacteriaceae bacterium]
AAKLAAAGQEEVRKEQSVRLDYFEIAGPDSLEPLEDIANGALVAVAALVGETRLIDNVVLESGGGDDAGENQGPSLRSG